MNVNWANYRDPLSIGSASNTSFPSFSRVLDSQPYGVDLGVTSTQPQAFSMVPNSTYDTVQFPKADPTSDSTGTLMGVDLGKLQLGFGGLQALGNLWNAFQGQKLAKQQFNFAKDFANRNLANQIKSYNTALTDRITSRASSNGLSQEQVDQYIKENRM